jgi:zinc protease
MRPRLEALAAVVTAFALALAPSAARAQEPPPRPEIGEPRPFPLPEIERYTLPNGLTVTLVPYGATPKATVRLVLPTGSVDEGAEEIWLAALTGDLLQEGTTTRSAEEIATEAASMGGTLSLGVGQDRTSVGGDVLREFAPDLVALIADVVRNPALPASELERLKSNRTRQLSVALQQPGTLTQVEFVRRIYPDHPYGRPLPTADLVEGFTLDGIRSFWSEHYGPEGAHLYVSGRFDADEVRAAVDDALASWSGGSAAEPVPATPARPSDVVLVERPGAPQSTLYLGLPVVDPSHEDHVRLQVTNALLGGAFGSRITRNIREDKGYTYSPQSLVSSRYRAAYWVQTADVGSDVTGPAISEILSEIERLREEAPPEAELEGIRNYLGGIFVLQNSSRGGIVGQLSYLDLHGLPPEYLEDYVERIQAVTPEDVLRTAREYLRPDDMLLVVTGDPEVALPQLREFGEVQVVSPMRP